MNNTANEADKHNLMSAEERTFFTHDGSELFFRYWPTLSQQCKGAIVLLHRGHEHSGRMAHLVNELHLPHHAFYAWDARGHGKSPGQRGYSLSVAATVRDLDCFVAHICENDGLSIEDISLVAQSVGAVIASTWVHDYAPSIRAMILASPAFSVKLYVPFARQGIRTLQFFKGPFFVNSYVKANLLTHDRERISSFRKDPLIARPIASDMLLDLHQTAKRVIADARAITVPTQLLISGADWVVRQEPQHKFFVNLGSRTKERHILPGFFHDTLGERDRGPVIEEVRRFLKERYAEPVEKTNLLDSDKFGFTRDERDRISTPLSPVSPTGTYWAIAKLMVRTGAYLSDGIKTGIEMGFDSGSALDYIYQNQPSGRGSIGRLIDKIYLNAIGWRGIRQRKTHLEELIHLAVEKLRANNQSTNILDVAAGHGRYVLDAIRKLEHQPDSVKLQDYFAVNVDAGHALLQEWGLSNRVLFTQGDAFDSENLANVKPSPDLSIVSGLYELFSENSLITTSLSGLSGAMKPGSLLVYTGQPWHPQLEMIARTLSSHRDGTPWVMRRRSQGELDQLVESAGFKKLEQRIDKWGIFTVSLAERL